MIKFESLPPPGLSWALIVLWKMSDWGSLCTSRRTGAALAEEPTFTSCLQSEPQQRYLPGRSLHCDVPLGWRHQDWLATQNRTEAKSVRQCFDKEEKKKKKDPLSPPVQLVKWSSRGLGRWLASSSKACRGNRASAVPSASPACEHSEKG